MHISHVDSRGAIRVFYTYFYNHARRLRLEKLLYLEPSIIASRSRSPNGFLNHIWIQVAVLLLELPSDEGCGIETAVTRQFQK
jgi:hypothetical protein